MGPEETKTCFTDGDPKMEGLGFVLSVLLWVCSFLLPMRMIPRINENPQNITWVMGVKAGVVLLKGLPLKRGKGMWAIFN